MRHDPQRPDWDERDRFILSKGHACSAVYAALAWQGYFPIGDLETFGNDLSPLMTHISHKIPGVEFSTGSLGHGLPFGAGKALAAKHRGAKWRTIVLLSDGEMDEGSNWEALMFASHHHLDRLTAIIDYNKLQSLGSVNSTLCLEPLADKLRAFGWLVVECDGHDHTALAANLCVREGQAQPTALIAHTTKGKGVTFMENEVAWHYRSPNENELKQALEEVMNA